MIDLDYDISDVAERLMELTGEEYCETKIDQDDLNPPQLFVFGKIIGGKLKIKGDTKRHILCVSFHYAAKGMNFPYKNKI